MAYEIPEQWAHGDYPTAAKLNKYKAGLDAIHDLWGDIDYEYAAMHLYAATFYHSHWLINRYRYLVYNGTGSIHDPGNVFDTVSLTAASWGTYDLTSIEWIIPGKLYEVQGVTEAYESDTGS